MLLKGRQTDTEKPEDKITGQPEKDEDSTGRNTGRCSRPVPFFSVFNYTSCHESQIRAPEKRYQANTRRLTPAQRHDPAAAPADLEALASADEAQHELLWRRLVDRDHPAA